LRSIWHIVRGIAFGLGAFALTAAPAPAQAWPQRTVRVIVPNPPGVGLDVIARLFAERLANRWGQPVIIENLPGADGIVAAREFVAKRDDHTLLYSFAGLISINPLLHEKLPYDPDRDLVPIASTSENALAIAASASLGVGSLDGLAQLARSRPGKLTWAATPGVPYFAFAAFQRRSGGEMVQASYRDFNQALVDLGEARIDAVAAGVAPLLPHARAGRLKLLAFINRERAPVAPEIPTVTEAGYGNLPVSGATGLFG
jgi:tripartite-type tricarboxylate transporter receptor subunit TctC